MAHGSKTIREKIWKNGQSYVNVVSIFVVKTNPKIGSFSIDYHFDTNFFHEQKFDLFNNHNIFRRIVLIL